MEDVLEEYEHRHKEHEVLVCIDETSKQHVKETRIPLPTRPGEPESLIIKYERHDATKLFMLFAPFEGWRHIKITGRHTMINWVQLI